VCVKLASVSLLWKLACSFFSILKYVLGSHNASLQDYTCNFTTF
jgi:hypothetical protein